MKFPTSHKPQIFTKVVAVVATLSAAVCAGSAQADDTPNPFTNLTQAQQQVTSYESAANGTVNLHSIDVDYTVGQLTTVLALTPAQQASAKQILTAQKERFATVRGDKSLARAERSIQTEAIYRTTVSSLNETLTNDQLLKAKVIQGQAMSDPDKARADKLFMFDARYAALSASEAVTQWGTALNLTSTQKEALLPTIENEIKSLDAIAADKTLAATNSCIRTQQVMVATERTIDAQLTPDQKTHLESVMLLGQCPNACNPRNNIAK